MATFVNYTCKSLLKLPQVTLNLVSSFLLCFQTFIILYSHMTSRINKNACMHAGEEPLYLPLDKAAKYSKTVAFSEVRCSGNKQLFKLKEKHFIMFNATK